MSSPRNHQHRRLLRAHQWSPGPVVTRNSSFTPWIRLALDPEEARGVREVPAFRVSIDFGFCGPLGDAVAVAVDGGEVKTALTSPVVHVDESRNNRRLILRRTVLPEPERLIAEVVLPLPIHRVTDTRVREDGTRRVESVETLRVVRALEVLVPVAGTGAGERNGGKPLCIAGKGFLEADAGGAWECLVLAVLGVFDVVAKLEEAAVVVEVGVLPEVGTCCEGTTDVSAVCHV